MDMNFLWTENLSFVQILYKLYHFPGKRKSVFHDIIKFYKSWYTGRHKTDYVLTRQHIPKAHPQNPLHSDSNTKNG